MTKAQRRRSARDVQGAFTGKTDRKVATVWGSDELRARWGALMNEHKQLLARITRRFALQHDIPADMRDDYEGDMSGTTRVIVDGDGAVVYKFESALGAVIAKALAELVHDHAQERITAAMITKRVESRLLDELRRSDEYERPLVNDLDPQFQHEPVTVTDRSGDRRTVPQPPPTAKRRRRTRRKEMPNRRYDPKSVTEDRGAALADRRRRLDRMPLLLRLLFTAHEMRKYPPGTAADILSTPSRRVTAREVEEALKDPYAVHERALAGLVPRPDLFVRSMVARSLMLAGDPVPSDLFDDGGEFES